MKKALLLQLIFIFCISLFSTAQSSWIISDTNYEFVTSYKNLGGKSQFPRMDNSHFIKIIGSFNDNTNINSVVMDSIYVVYELNDSLYKKSHSHVFCNNGSISFSREKGGPMLYGFGNNPANLSLYFEVPKSVNCGLSLKFAEEFIQIMEPCQ